MIIYILLIALLASTITLSVLLAKRTKDMNYWKEKFLVDLGEVSREFADFKSELLVKLPRVNADSNHLFEEINATDSSKNA